MLHNRDRGRSRAASISGFWRDLLLPMVIITLTGALAVLFLAMCNRVPYLETVSDRLERRIAEERVSHLELTAQLADVSSPPALQDFAPRCGLTEQQPPQDVVIIPTLPAASHVPQPAAAGSVAAQPTQKLAQAGHPAPQ